MKRDAFQAIADPTRREILHMLSIKPLSINAVGENFEMTRAAVYKHIKILRECDMIEIKQYGRERFCEAKFDRLKDVAVWVEHYKTFWTKKLDALEKYLNTSKSISNKYITTKSKKRITKKLK